MSNPIRFGSTTIHMPIAGNATHERDQLLQKLNASREDIFSPSLPEGLSSEDRLEALGQYLERDAGKELTLEEAKEEAQDLENPVDPKNPLLKVGPAYVKPGDNGLESIRIDLDEERLPLRSFLKTISLLMDYSLEVPRRQFQYSIINPAYNSYFDFIDSMQANWLSSRRVIIIPPAHSTASETSPPKLRRAPLFHITPIPPEETPET